MSKYYTPEINDFHWGLDYEIYWSKLGEWKKFTVDEWFSFETLEKDLINGEYRVKYLDIEDIKSLGWIPPKGTDFTRDNLMFLNRNKNYDLIFIKKDNFVVIRREKMHVIFQGTIKNKSELKKVLKMVGV